MTKWCTEQTHLFMMLCSTVYLAQPGHKLFERIMLLIFFEYFMVKFA